MIVANGGPVLVTGAAGFLGRHAARAFARRGCTVVGLGHGELTPHDAAAWGISTFVKGDITLTTLTGLFERHGAPSLTVHAAGGASVGRSLQDPLLDFERTVRTTAILIDALRRAAPGSLLVYPSSAAVYGAG